MTQEGDRLGKYHILENIGEGGFATVYRALDTTLDCERAVKVLHPLLMRDGAWVERFRQEAKAIARLNDPHIVTVHEINDAGGRLFIAMELIKGPSLDKLITELGRLSWEETLEVLDQVASALDYAHDEGVLHRDLKPANILMDPRRGAILTDFGFAKLVGESSMSVSVSGGIVGTPAYVAPEVWNGEQATRQTDIYSLACVVYQMLTGRVLFDGGTPPEVMRQHIIDGPQFAEGLLQSQSQAAQAALMPALAPKPEERYESAREMLAALRSGDDGAPRPEPKGRQAPASKTAIEELLPPEPLDKPHGPPADSRCATTPFRWGRQEVWSTAHLIWLAVDHWEEAVSMFKSGAWDSWLKKGFSDEAIFQETKGVRKRGKRRPDMGLALFLAHPRMIEGVDDDGRTVLIRALVAETRRAIRELRLESAMSMGHALSRLAGGSQVTREVKPLPTLVDGCLRNWSRGQRSFTSGDIANWLSGEPDLSWFSRWLRKEWEQAPPLLREPGLAQYACGLRESRKGNVSLGLATFLSHPQIVAQLEPQSRRALAGRLIDEEQRAVEAFRLYVSTEVRQILARLMPDAEFSGEMEPTRALLRGSLSNWSQGQRCFESGTLHSWLSDEPDLSTYVAQLRRRWKHAPRIGFALTMSHPRILARMTSEEKDQVVENIVADAKAAGQELRFDLAAALLEAGERLAPGSKGLDEVRSALPAVSAAPLIRLEAKALVTSVALSPGSGVLAAASGDGLVRLWDLWDGTLIHALRHTQSQTREERTLREHWARSVDFSPDGTMLVSGGYDSAIRLWGVTRGERIRSFEGHDDAVTCVTFAPDGSTIASASKDCTARVWEVADGTVQLELSGIVPQWCVAFSPDGKAIASGSEAGSVWLWSLETGAVCRRLEGHEKTVYAVAFSPSGEILASGSWDGTVRLWRTSDGVLLSTLRSHSDGVSGIAFSPDGSQLVSVSGDATTRLWRVSDGAVLATLGSYSAATNAVAYSADGGIVASGAKDGTIQVWHVSVGGEDADLTAPGASSGRPRVSALDSLAHRPGRVAEEPARVLPSAYHPPMRTVTVSAESIVGTRRVLALREDNLVLGHMELEVVPIKLALRATYRDEQDRHFDLRSSATKQRVDLLRNEELVGSAEAPGLQMDRWEIEYQTERYALEISRQTRWLTASLAGAACRLSDSSGNVVMELDKPGVGEQIGALLDSDRRKELVEVDLRVAEGLPSPLIALVWLCVGYLLP